VRKIGRGNEAKLRKKDQIRASSLRKRGGNKGKKKGGVVVGGMGRKRGKKG